MPASGWFYGGTDRIVRPPLGGHALPRRIALLAPFVPRTEEHQRLAREVLDAEPRVHQLEAPAAVIGLGDHDHFGRPEASPTSPTPCRILRSSMSVARGLVQRHEAVCCRPRPRATTRGCVLSPE